MREILSLLLIKSFGEINDSTFEFKTEWLTANIYLVWLFQISIQFNFFKKHAEIYIIEKHLSTQAKTYFLIRKAMVTLVAPSIFQTKK